MASRGCAGAHVCIFWKRNQRRRWRLLWGEHLHRESPPAPGTELQCVPSAHSPTAHTHTGEHKHILHIATINIHVHIEKKCIYINAWQPNSLFPGWNCQAARYVTHNAGIFSMHICIHTHTPPGPWLGGWPVGWFYWCDSPLLDSAASQRWPFQMLQSVCPGYCPTPKHTHTHF